MWKAVSSSTSRDVAGRELNAMAADAVFVDIDAESSPWLLFIFLRNIFSRLWKIANVAHARLDDVVFAQEFSDCFRLCWRLDDDEANSARRCCFFCHADALSAFCLQYLDSPEPFGSDQT